MTDPIYDLFNLVRYRLKTILLITAVLVGLASIALIATEPNPLGLDGDVITIKWTTPTPNPTMTPASAINATVNATPLPTPGVAINITVTATPTPMPTAIIEENQTGNNTIVGSPKPIDKNETVAMIGDQAYYEDYKHPASAYAAIDIPDIPSVQKGNSSVVLDLEKSYFGRPNPFPGDTIGMKLRLFNTGQTVQEDAHIDLTVDKQIIGDIWINNTISRNFNTLLSIPAGTAVYKNLSITVPDNVGMLSINGYYRVNVNVSYSRGYFRMTYYIRIQ